MTINFINAEEKVMRVGYLSVHTENGILDPKIKYYYENLIAPPMGVTIEWVGPLPFARILVSLKTGDIDMFYTMSRSQERMEYVLYPDTPSWYETAPMVVLKENENIVIENDKDLYGYKISYCLDMIKPKFSEDKNVDITYIPGDHWGKAALLRLIQGNFDMAFFPSTVQYNGFKNELKKEYSDKFTILELPQNMLGPNIGKHYDGFSKVTGSFFLPRYEAAIKEVGIFQDFYLSSSK